MRLGKEKFPSFSNYSRYILVFKWTTGTCKVNKNKLLHRSFLQRFLTDKVFQDKWGKKRKYLLEKIKIYNFKKVDFQVILKKKYLSWIFITFSDRYSYFANAFPVAMFWFLSALKSNKIFNFDFYYWSIGKNKKIYHNSKVLLVFNGFCGFLVFACCLSILYSIPV